MQLLTTAAAVRAAAAGAALVPTMGGLHEGHLALVRHARALAETVVASIYVNPLQFGANEDFGSYPRCLQEDCGKLQGLADIVYAPSDAEMYPQPQTIGISLPPIADRFCGATRPGFFHGVATVVCKLFNQCRPAIAVFGRKDYQQALLVEMMSRQLNLDVQIALHPTVRAADGLAHSSRNAYLSADERRQAPKLYAALRAAAEKLQQGSDDFDGIAAAAAADIAAAGMECDYAAVRAAADLGAPARGADMVLLAAAQLGRARLIDNIAVAADGQLL